MLSLFQQIFTYANVTFMLKGLGMTVAIAVLATIISMFFGTFLALIRTYASGKFKWTASLVAAYTEFFRCTPNLLWILWIYFTVKGNKIAVSVFAISLFTSAVMAEIFRGGLNAIPKGQFEAAQSQGFTFL
ncbi:MAG: ABC transporter permease subunit, partial [Lachnospiraceae bacterium]|nr:ABC transporter permease subunit [Lachnospiraceae bacterium]